MYVHRFNCDTFQIRLFLAVAEEKSFSRAAVKMYIEPATLSRRISTLETALGYKLFSRRQRPLQLTAEGELLYEKWLPLISILDSSVEAANDLHNSSEMTLNVCSIESCNIFNDLPTISMIMRQEVPELSLSFQYTNFAMWRQQMLKGVFDLVLTLEFDTAGLGSNFVCQKIVEVPKLACVLKTNPLCAKDNISFSDLKDQRIVLVDEKYSPRMKGYLTQLFSEHGMEPVFGKVVSNTHAIISALQDNDDVIICDILLRGYDHPALKAYELPDVKSSLCAIWLKCNQNPNIEIFVQHLMSFFS